MIESQSTVFVAQVGRSVSIEKAAQLLGVCRRTVYNRIKDGRLATLRTPWGSRRVLLTSLLELKGAEQGVDPRMLGLAQ
jgi:excisionase family DNA binding protein